MACEAQQTNNDLPTFESQKGQAGLWVPTLRASHVYRKSEINPMQRDMKNAANEKMKVKIKIKTAVW